MKSFAICLLLLLSLAFAQQCPEICRTGATSSFDVFMDCIPLDPALCEFSFCDTETGETGLVCTAVDVAPTPTAIVTPVPDLADVARPRAMPDGAVAANSA